MSQGYEVGFDLYLDRTMNCESLRDMLVSDHVASHLYPFLSFCVSIIRSMYFGSLTPVRCDPLPISQRVGEWCWAYEI
jgi:hypothetical protein